MNAYLSSKEGQPSQLGGLVAGPEAYRGGREGFIFGRQGFVDGYRGFLDEYRYVISSSYERSRGRRKPRLGRGSAGTGKNRLFSSR